MSEKQCEAGNCTEPARGAHLCPRHQRKWYELGRLNGRYDLVDAAPAGRRVALLRRRGWSLRLITEHSRVGRVLLTSAQNGTRTHLHRFEADAIMAIVPTYRDSIVPIVTVGIGRRLDALAWMGWSRNDIADRIGVSSRTLWRAKSRQVVAARVARLVSEFYDQNSHIEGPSYVARGLAIKAGAAPPAAWDEHSIDDPDAQPVGVRPSMPRARSAKRIYLDDIIRLREAGTSWRQMGLTIGVRSATLRDMWNAEMRRRAQEDKAA